MTTYISMAPPPDTIEVDIIGGYVIGASYCYDRSTLIFLDGWLKKFSFTLDNTY